MIRDLNARQRVSPFRVSVWSKTAPLLPRLFAGGVLSCLLFAAGGLAHEREVRIGVLAKRGVQVAVSQWQPTADYLSAQIPEHRFSIVPLDFDEIYSSVETGDVDFVLANSGFYVELEARYGASPIATLKNRLGDNVSSVFGGVVFTQAKREEIQRLEDVRGKRFAAVDRTSLGGFLMASGVLHDLGVDPFKDTELSFEGTHDAVVYAVAAGKADVGTVRTDTLERMAEEGKIELADFRVLPPSDPAARDSGFPYLVTTPLYPEWPMASLPHTPVDHAQEVAVALLQMPQDGPAARASRSAGWGIPRNYQRVHDLFKALGVPPYSKYGKVTLRAVLSQYWPWLAAILLSLSGLVMGFARSVTLNRKLAASRGELSRARDELELRVQERTEDLEQAIRSLGQEVEERRQIQQRLASLGQYMRLLLDSAGEGIFGIDTDGKITFVNPQAQRLLGWSEEELLGGNMHERTHHSRADGSPYPEHECPIHSVVSLRQAHRADDEIFWRRDGTSFPVEYVSTPVFEADEPTGAVVIFKDSTEQRLAEARLRQVAAVFDATDEGIMITDAENRIVEVNQAFTELTEYGRSEVVGRNPSFLRSGRHDAEFYRSLWQSLADTGHWSGEIWNRRKSGEIFPEWVNINVIEDTAGQVSNYIAVFTDISAYKRSEQRLEFLAQHDPLTQLPNRVLFRDRLEHALKTAERSQRKTVLMFLDLDRFKQVNDRIGHQAGDVLLQNVAERLRRTLRDEDTVARIGGDEFTILIEDVQELGDVRYVARKILRGLERPAYRLQGHEFRLGASIGISVFPHDGNDAESLLRLADSAMYKAKGQGRNQYCFAGELAASQSESRSR